MIPTMISQLSELVRKCQLKQKWIKRMSCDARLSIAEQITWLECVSLTKYAYGQLNVYHYVCIYVSRAIRTESKLKFKLPE